MRARLLGSVFLASALVVGWTNSASADYKLRGGSHRNCGKEFSNCVQACPPTTGQVAAIGIRCQNGCDTALDSCTKESEDAKVLQPPQSTPVGKSRVHVLPGGSLLKHKP